MNSVTDSPEMNAEDLIEWYYAQGYSDGLPLVPRRSASRVDAQRGLLRMPFAGELEIAAGL